MSGELIGGSLAAGTDPARSDRRGVGQGVLRHALAEGVPGNEALGARAAIPEKSFLEPALPAGS